MGRFRSDDADWRAFKQEELENELYWEEVELREEAKRKREEREKEKIRELVQKKKSNS